MSGNILLDIPTRLLGEPQAPDWPLCVQSNTPDGVALRSLRSLIPAHPRRKGNALSGRFLIPYWAVKNQNIHPAGIAVFAFYQIAINVKISKTETAKFFFK